MGVPRLDPDWLAWLDSAGFVEERPFVRMYLGDRPDPGASQHHFAIAGPEFA